MNNLRLEIQKRHTLNWLIQGAAQHAGMTFHHLVADELNILNSRLLQFYDQYALINLLQYWQTDGAILLGWPPHFWQQARSKQGHPFFGHPLLSKYGGTLAEAGRQRALVRCKEKGFTRLPIAFSFQALYVIERLRTLETPHRPQLVRLAKEAASIVWGIPDEQLDAELCTKTEMVRKGKVIPTRNLRGAVFRSGIVGYGGVVQRGDGLTVVGKGTNWQLLCKELVKGTAELICLHGLNQLDDETYRQVLNVTDHLDLEPWMLQSGGEFWRRILSAVPEGQPLAKMLMNLARLPAGTLESVIAEMIDRPESAKVRLANLD
jgi:hypothetical protein